MTHRWSMSVDLSGPHPIAVCTKFRHLMVGVVTTEDEKTRLPFVRGLTSKKVEEEAEAARSVVARCMVKKRLLTRFHSDAGGERFNNIVAELLKEMRICQSSTGGNDPKSNGLAERFAGIIKHKAAAYLTHAELSLSFWYWAAMQVGYTHRTEVLD